MGGGEYKTESVQLRAGSAYIKDLLKSFNDMNAIFLNIKGKLGTLGNIDIT